jgi:Zn-dependent peptidase ImmA (M78 family)
MAFIRKSKPSKDNASLGLDIAVETPDVLLKFANENGIETEPLNVVSLVKLLDIKLRFEPMDDESSGLLEKDKKGNWCMHVNSLHHPNRQRFTIAHELGHRFLHGEFCNEFADKIFFRNGQPSQAEAEANSFAAALLMPEKSFKAYVVGTSSKVEDIASYFQVSSLAVRFRAKSLGYSGHNV